MIDMEETSVPIIHQVYNEEYLLLHLLRRPRVNEIFSSVNDSVSRMRIKEAINKVKEAEEEEKSIIDS